MPQETAAQRAAELREENDQLWQLHSRAEIDRAIGVLLTVGDVPPDQGGDYF
ncbi:hypothetical protein [Streptomyces sp. NPDC102487]|uniref:hypothetical protein n=1 Tax=Streptomyces sp. NPDC102487 TaxID=3366182 RepID=UPI0038052DFB